MSTEIHTVTVRIMNRETKIQCPRDKIKELQEAAVYLEEKMIGLAVGDNAFSLDKTAMVAALNIVRELMALKRQDKTYLHVVAHRLRELKNKIEQELVND